MNCEHRADAHDDNGCEVGRYSVNPCTCLMEYYEGSGLQRTRCLWCGHDPHDGKDACSGILDGGPDPGLHRCPCAGPPLDPHRCQARSESEKLRCAMPRRHEGDLHIVGGFRFSEAYAVYPEPQDETPRLANPDRTRAGDTQVGGDHYRQAGIQPWDIVDAYQLGYYPGSVLKYLLRAGRKGSKVEDYKKARHFLDKMIELEEGES